MPKYQFVAESPNQESHKGTVEAPSHAAARQKLEQHGFRVLTIVPVEEERRPMPPGKASPNLEPLEPLDPSPLQPLDPSPLQPLDALSPGLEMPVARPAYTSSAAPQSQPMSVEPDLPQVQVDEEHWRPLARSFDPWFLDIMFRRFVTPNAVTVIFTLALVCAVISLLFITWTTGRGIYNTLWFSSQFRADASSTALQLGFFLFSWLFSLLAIIFWLFLVRLGCEAMLVIFRMSETMERIRKQITRYTSQS